MKAIQELEVGGELCDMHYWNWYDAAANNGRLCIKNKHRIESIIQFPSEHGSMFIKAQVGYQPTNKLLVILDMDIVAGQWKITAGWSYDNHRFGIMRITADLDQPDNKLVYKPIW